LLNHYTLGDPVQERERDADAGAPDSQISVLLPA